MSEVIGRVIANNGSVEGSEVKLSNGEIAFNGKVAAESVDEFLVDWEDGARTVENKSDYELIVEARTAAENPAQPAGFAVPPVDADAYPGGELMAIEQEKRGETAQWEDSQNRQPVDAENPAQPGGWAVAPATGAPIPGQGADGLMMAATVYAEDVTGEGGVVEITKGNLRVAGRVIAADDDSFIVEWEDDRRTVESKADYDLIIEAGIQNILLKGLVKGLDKGLDALEKHPKLENALDNRVTRGIVQKMVGDAFEVVPNSEVENKESDSTEEDDNFNKRFHDRWN